MTECVQCRGKAQLFLCQPCASELRDMLVGLARGQLLPSGHYAKGWLDFLHDEAVGDTRKGESARRSSDLTTPMPVNLKASELYNQVGNTLTTCVRDLCETRGAMFHPVQSVGVAFIGPLLADWVRLPTGYVATSGDCARWLARHVDAIAADESAGVVFAEIKRCVEEIERVINRPIPDRFLGPCPALLNDNYGERICNAELTSPHRDEDLVQCAACKTTHCVAQLHDQLMRTTDAMSFTLHELYRMILPINRESVPLRTLQHWVARNKLVPTGYGADGEPRFLLAHVRELREKKPQKVLTGGSVHLKNKRAS